MTTETLAAVTRYPLMHAAPPAGIVARRSGVAIGLETFLGDIAALAVLLPVGGHVVNLCRDRYRFLVGFAAAMCRGQVSLLPPSESASLIEDLVADFPGLYVLHDGEAPAIATPMMVFPELVPGRGEMPSFPADQVAAVLFTSGSTGRPQPHARNWGMLVRSARSAGFALGVDAFPGAALIGTVPHQHSYGLESLVMLALQHGLVLHAERPFYPGDIRDRLAEVEGPRMLVTTPVHLRVVLEDGLALPRTDLVLSATAPLSPQLARAAEARFDGPVREIYGCSEAGQLAARRTTDGDEWCCLDGILLRQDGVGTIASSVSAAHPVVPEARLGDIIELRDATRFVLLGRTGDMVEIAGKRTSLAHLGFHLNAIPGVEDGVFALSDGAGPALVRRLMAVVVAPGLSATDILAALRPRIDPAFLPRPVHMVDALPRNTMGKVTRATMDALLEQYGQVASEVDPNGGT